MTTDSEAFDLDRAHVFHSWSAQAALSPLVFAGGSGTSSRTGWTSTGWRCSAGGVLPQRYATPSWISSPSGVGAVATP